MRMREASLDYHYPECQALESALERAILLCGTNITLDDLPPEMTQSRAAGALRR